MQRGVRDYNMISVAEQDPNLKYKRGRNQDFIDKLGRAYRLSQLDMISGYWQMRVAEKDVVKTTFNTRYDKYEVLVMSFGLMNASSIF